MKNLKNDSDWLILSGDDDGDNLQKNQLYHPTALYRQDSYKYVYIKNFDIASKFLPIFLKEWFFLVLNQGYLIIDFENTKNIRLIEKNLWWLWRDKFEIISNFPIDFKSDTNSKKEIINIIERCKSEKLPYIESATKPRFIINENYQKRGQRIIIRKTISTKIDNDSIAKWSFGIVTNGDRIEWLRRSLQSIRKQKIPNYEIIICGKYIDPLKKDIVYIPFNLRDNEGWITKKKNIIVDTAKYENICLIHDRAIFSEDWYLKMKVYGNCFEYLTNKQFFRDKRAYDWTTLGGPPGTMYKMELLDYHDWDKWTLIGGLEIISKKSILSKIRFNESLFWNESEDIDLSYAMQEAGFLPRINNVKIETLGFRHGKIPAKNFENKNIIPDMMGRRIIRNIARLTVKLPYVHQKIEYFCTTNIYKRIIGMN
jgi:hypothetical protein